MKKTAIQIVKEYNLEHYFRLIWNCPNLNLPYHNLEHLVGVMILVHEACQYHEIDKVTTRLLLIAALFHDYDHTGVMGDDSVNINRAVKALTLYIAEKDYKHFQQIQSYIRATEFPHAVIVHAANDENLPLYIMRDADTAYTLNERWMQSVIGIGIEMGLGIANMPALQEKMLKMQEPFMTKVMTFSTEWAKEKYKDIIEQRLTEVRDMISVLYP